MIDFETFKNTVTRMRIGYEATDTILNTYPEDIMMAICDNSYVNEYGLMIDYLMAQLFGPELMDDVSWFLYEWRPGFTVSNVSGKEYTLNSMDEYFEYVKEEYYSNK